MARTMVSSSPHQVSSEAMRMPATTEMISGRRVRSCGASRDSTTALSCGLIATTRTVASAMAAVLSASVRMPKSRSRAPRTASLASPTRMWSGRTPRRTSPPTSARPMWPPPMIAIPGKSTVADCIASFDRVARTLTEERRTDAHHRRALEDGGLEVGTHAHREGIEVRAARVERVKQLSGLCEPVALTRQLRLGRWQAHESAQGKPRQLCHGAGQCRQLRRRYACLARLGSDVDLQAHVERRRVKGPLGGEALRDAYPIHAMHPVEPLGDGTRLVGLDLPDEVPADRELRERLPLCERLAQVVFPEVRQAGALCRAYRFGRLRLADRHECDRVDIPAAQPCGCSNACSHTLQGFRQILRT